MFSLYFNTMIRLIVKVKLYDVAVEKMATLIEKFCIGLPLDELLIHMMIWHCLLIRSNVNSHHNECSISIWRRYLFNYSRYLTIGHSFKIFTMLKARKLGFEQVIWLDSACYAIVFYF